MVSLRTGAPEFKLGSVLSTILKSAPFTNLNECIAGDLSRTLVVLFASTSRFEVNILNRISSAAKEVERAIMIPAKISHFICIHLIK